MSVNAQKAEGRGSVRPNEGCFVSSLTMMRTVPRLLSPSYKSVVWRQFDGRLVVFDCKTDVASLERSWLK